MAYYDGCPSSSASAGSSASSGEGIILCIAIFLILLLLFRGVKSRQDCVIYLQGNDGAASTMPAPPVLSYAEKSDKTAPSPSVASDGLMPSFSTTSSYTTAL